MKRSHLINSAPALAVILALSSTSAYGASVRGGSISSEKTTAAQGTARQSTDQQGSVDPDSSTQGAAQRLRSGSFLKPASVASRNAATSATSVIAEEPAISEKDREIAAHFADAQAFIYRELNLQFRNRMEARVNEVKELVLHGPKTEQEKMIFELVADLAKTDENALHALSLLVAKGIDVVTLEQRKPELANSIQFLLGKLKSLNLVVLDKGSLHVKIFPNMLAAILATPEARALLHKLTDSETQQKHRQAIAVQRANSLNGEDARKSIETIQSLKSYIGSMYEQSGVELHRPNKFMTELFSYTSASANGGVLLIFRGAQPQEIHTAHGSVYSGSATYQSRAYESFERYKEDLGLELISSIGDRRAYAVTRLPDGTKIPKASLAPVFSPVSSTEISETFLEVPKNIREGLTFNRFQGPPIFSGTAGSR